MALHPVITYIVAPTESSMYSLLCVVPIVVAPAPAIIVNSPTLSDSPDQHDIAVREEGTAILLIDNRLPPPLSYLGSVNVSLIRLSDTPGSSP